MLTTSDFFSCIPEYFAIYCDERHRKAVRPKLDVIKTFGNYVEKWCEGHPERARWLLKTGWEAENLKFTVAPSKRMNPSDQYLAKLMMNIMLQPLKHPESSVLVSVFTPCELIQEAGLYPYNVESFSCYLTASQAERAFLQNAEDSGFQRLSAVITKRLLEQQRKGFCQNRNALYIRTLHAMQIFLLFTDWQNFIMCRSFRLMCHPDRQRQM